MKISIRKKDDISTIVKDFSESGGANKAKKLFDQYLRGQNRVERVYPL